MSVIESTTECYDVVLTSTDFTIPTIAARGIISIDASGTSGAVKVQYANGTVRTKNMIAGDEWRCTPAKILKTGTTATGIKWEI